MAMDPTRIREYAFNHHREILVEIAAEINTVDALLRDLSISLDSFRPQIQFAFRRMNACKKETESIVASIDHMERKIQDFDQNPAIQQILQLEVKKSENPQFTNQLIREIRHLKSIHAQKISSRVSVQRQLLQERLRLVRIWKSVLSDEIQILEETRKLLIEKITALAHYADDPATQEMIQIRLKEISSRDNSISEKKFDTSKIQVANIHVLRETLLKQLSDITCIERVVGEKREILKSLNQVILELEAQITHTPLETPSPVEEPLPPPPIEENPPAPPPMGELDFPEYKPTRMVLRDRREKR